MNENKTVLCRSGASGVIAGLLLLAMSLSGQARAEVSEQSALARYDAWLVVYDGTAAEKLDPQTMRRVVLLDVKHLFMARADDFGPLFHGESNHQFMFTADGRRPPVTLHYGNGKYYATSWQDRQRKKPITMALYPLIRTGMDYLSKHRVGEREMLYMQGDESLEDFSLCSNGYRIQNGALQALYYDKNGITAIDRVAERGDVLSFTPEGVADAETIYELAYQLADNDGIRFTAGLNSDDPKQGGTLISAFKCEQVSGGAYWPVGAAGRYFKTIQR